MVVFLALLASCLYALASVCQRLGVEATPGDAPSTGLIHQMLRRRIWIVGFVMMTLGYVIQSIALHLGSVVVVQPLMVSELLAVVGILWFWYATPWRARDVASVLAAVAGLVTFLVVASPSAGTSSPHAARWIVTSVVIAALATGLISLGSRGPDWWRALFLGAGASVGFAFLAVVTKSLTAVLMSDWLRALFSWQLYALAFIGLTSFVVMQHAFRAGSLAISQSALILTNPIVSIILGSALFHEELRAGALAVTLEVLSLVVLVGGAISLCLSASFVDVYDENPERHILAGRGRYARRHAHPTV
ncbi:MAG TPA: DMT family transporter [Acidimicrobiales bacterium]|nr:DMT family transporter [Acidimicrobiales bacterium]